jgi:hypothetical protein
MSSFFRPSRLSLLPVAILASATFTFVGCGKSDMNSERPPVSIDELESDSPSGHKHAETYPEAVAELEEMNKTIASAFANNDVDAAHDPLHEVGHVLDELPGLAKKQELGDEAVAAISAAVETLFDAFGKVDEKFHGGEGATYDEVKAKVDSSMDVLRKYLPASEAAAPASEAAAPAPAESAAPAVE